ncbi:MAG: hypothetical protein QNK37_02915 [Acidobacteriota bacterium]|nr:hypothetical protein [Acidobacteriota bacterium]
MALTGMITFTSAYPQITRLMTGKEHSDPSFRKQYAESLRRIAEQPAP